VTAFGELTVPDYGPMGRHAPYDPTLITVPEPQVLPDDRDEYEVRVRIDGRDVPIFYRHHPCDVEGWKGDYFPFVFNIRDWNVVMSDSLHLPPSMHVFLHAPGVQLIHFLPRPFEGVTGAERLPYYHRNADYDEVAFFHDGALLGNPLPAGRLEHSPQGLHHGPPEAARELARATFTQFDRVEWKIISVDTRRRLNVDPRLTAAPETGDGGQA
jgi:homogentisate 1,2-dioxygenase